GPGGAFDGLDLWLRRRWIPQGTDAGDRRDVPHEFQPFPHQVGEIEEDTGNVATRSREGRDVSAFDRVGLQIYRDDGERPGGILRFLERLRPDGEDRLHLESNEL